MRRLASALVVSCAVIADAQQWNDSRVLTLVREATALRARQLADSGLVDYRATAHGYLTFLAQLGEGFREPPRVVKADELALEVYWRAPNLSKQRIVGRRDTTLLPTDIQYHRDHLGIVQNNFPAIIRLGDGDEVQDVPHPLSTPGLGEYDFALTDSLRIVTPGRAISVYEVKVRPKDDGEPRVIGAVYLDRDNAQVVRMALSFTRAAFLDRQLEDLFVVLENGIVGARFWLPRRQEIEIRRTATWLDYPARGIIRGRWEIGEYQLNNGLPAAVFAGPEIVTAAPEVRARHAWPSARILDSLPPDIRAVTAEEIRRVQAEVRELVREQALRRPRGSALAARRVSDFARFNRVEGLALGAGLSWQLGRGWGLATRGRYGLEDHEPKGEVELNWQSATGRAFRAFYTNDLVDVSDVAERSGLVNSLAAQEAASDYTNLYGSERVGVGAAAIRGATRWSLDLAREAHRPLAVHASAASGTFEPPIPAAEVELWRAALRADRATSIGWFDTDFRYRAELRGASTFGAVQALCGEAACGSSTMSLRPALALEIDRAAGRATLRSRILAAAVISGENVLAQELVFLGGPVSAPGYGFHALVGNRAASQTLELEAPVPFPAISLGRFGRSPGSARLVPHATGVWIHAVQTGTPILRATRPAGPEDPLRPVPSGFYPSFGVSLIAAFDLLRFDVSRGLRPGSWVFSMDVSRTFWSIL
jgi:hypothetical protein